MKQNSIERQKQFKSQTSIRNSTLDQVGIIYFLFNRLSLEQKLEIIAPIAEELINKDELIKLLQTKTFPRVYDGFEPSGRIHIAQGLLRAANVNRLVDAGCIFIFWVADWFGLLNNKMGGDLHKIKTVGRYFIEVWKAVGMKMHNV